jgi:hypothetical protein
MGADQMTAEGGGLNFMEDRVRSAGREAHRVPRARATPSRKVPV